MSTDNANAYFLAAQAFQTANMDVYSYANINTATTTVVKASPGTIKAVLINIKGTVASVVTVYDSLTASGPKIATLDSLNTSGVFTYGAKFNTGLTIVTTGTVAPDITVIYK